MSEPQDFSQYRYEVAVLNLFVVWPTQLAFAAVYNGLHQRSFPGMGPRGGISRVRFFCYAFVCSLVYYFFPGYIFQGKASNTSCDALLMRLYV